MVYFETSHCHAGEFAKYQLNSKKATIVLRTAELQFHVNYIFFLSLSTLLGLSILYVSLFPPFTNCSLEQWKDHSPRSWLTWIIFKEGRWGRIMSHKMPVWGFLCLSLHFPQHSQQQCEHLCILAASGQHGLILWLPATIIKWMKWKGKSIFLFFL